MTSMIDDFRFIVRNFRRRPGRYSTLGAAMILACAAMIFVWGSLSGMQINLLKKAAVYYGGDFSVHAMTKDGLEMIPDAARVLALLDTIPGAKLQASPRIVDRSAGCYLFFAGASARLKMMTGVDWGREKAAFNNLNFVSGSADAPGALGMLISEQMAEALGAKVGDDVLVLANTASGQKNTATAIIRGIFRDSSFLGTGNSYVDMGFLRSLISYPSGAVTEIAGNFSDGKSSPDRIAALQFILVKVLPMFQLAVSRDALFKMQAEENWEGQRYAILTLEAHIGRINQVVSAISIGLWILVAFLFGIVAFGITNTYRVIIHERTREIGTMRAMGMQRLRVLRLFIMESACLATVSGIAGIILGLLLLFGLHAAPLSRIPGLDVFLSHGQLSWKLEPLALAAVLFCVIVVSAVASYRPATTAAKIEPAVACLME